MTVGHYIKQVCRAIGKMLNSVNCLDACSFATRLFFLMRQ
jgi:hypothetical protein